MTHRKTVLNEILLPLKDMPTLTVKSRVPSKYLLVDTETGQIYQGQTNEQYHWKLQATDPTLVEHICTTLKTTSNS